MAAPDPLPLTAIPASGFMAISICLPAPNSATSPIQAASKPVACHLMSHHFACHTPG